jgi:hypothetical protein
VKPPTNADFAAQLRQLLEEGHGGITSVRGLARKLSDIDGVDIETHRRELTRYLAGTQPREKKVISIREAFGIGLEELPTPHPRTRLGRVEARLADIEKRLVRLETEHVERKVSRGIEQGIDGNR